MCGLGGPNIVGSFVGAGSFPCCIVVFPESVSVRRQLVPHATVFDAAFGARSREVRRWLRNPSGDLRGRWFLSVLRTGGSRGASFDATLARWESASGQAPAQPDVPANPSRLPAEAIDGHARREPHFASSGRSSPSKEPSSALISKIASVRVFLSHARMSIAPRSASRVPCPVSPARIRPSAGTSGRPASPAPSTARPRPPGLRGVPGRTPNRDSRSSRLGRPRSPS